MIRTMVRSRDRAGPSVRRARPVTVTKYNVTKRVTSKMTIKCPRRCAVVAGPGIPPFRRIAFLIRLTVRSHIILADSHRPWGLGATPHDHFSSVTSCTNDYDEHVALLLSSETFEFRLPHANTPRSPFVAPRAPMIAPARRRLRIHRAAGGVASPHDSPRASSPAHT